jgi:hypothetical protein
MRKKKTQKIQRYSKLTVSDQLWKIHENPPAGESTTIEEVAPGKSSERINSTICFCCASLSGST